MGAGMPVWPGTAQPEFSEISTIADDGFSERRLQFSSHTGTHLDAPAHIIEGGDTLDVLTPDRFFGKGVLVDLRHLEGAQIEAGIMLALAPKLMAAEFLLLQTGWCRYWGSEAYDSGFPVFSTDAARWVAASGLKGVGIDASSFDTAETHEYPVHRILLGAGKLLVENLTGLDQLGQMDEEADFWLSIFPLSICCAEACPVRAVAIVFP
jgi:kynurenine formamidase